MIRINIKLFFILLVLFLIDVVKPLGYSLVLEFLFLGIIFVSLNESIVQPLVLSIFFGFLKDLFILESSAFSFIEFPLICLFVRYCLSYFSFVSRQSYIMIVRIVIPAAAIFIHLVFNSICIGRVFVSFSLVFFAQSFIMFYFMANLLEKWARLNLPRTIS